MTRQEQFLKERGYEHTQSFFDKDKAVKACKENRAQGNRSQFVKVGSCEKNRYVYHIYKG